MPGDWPREAYDQSKRQRDCGAQSGSCMRKASLIPLIAASAGVYWSSAKDFMIDARDLPGILLAFLETSAEISRKATGPGE